MLISYKIVRFKPYPARGEFVNVGIVAYSNDDNTAAYYLADCSKRVRNFFPFLQEGFFDAWLEGMDSELDYSTQRVSTVEGFNSFFPSKKESIVQYSGGCVRKFTEDLHFQQAVILLTEEYCSV